MSIEGVPDEYETAFCLESKFNEFKDLCQFFIIPLGNITNNAYLCRVCWRIFFTNSAFAKKEIEGKRSIFKLADLFSEKGVVPLKEAKNKFFKAVGFDIDEEKEQIEGLPVPNLIMPGSQKVRAKHPCIDSKNRQTNDHQNENDQTEERDASDDESPKLGKRKHSRKSAGQALKVKKGASSSSKVQQVTQQDSEEDEFFASTGNRKVAKKPKAQPFPGQKANSVQALKDQARKLRSKEPSIENSEEEGEEEESDQEIDEHFVRKLEKMLARLPVGTTITFSGENQKKRLEIEEELDGVKVKVPQE